METYTMSSQSSSNANETDRENSLIEREQIEIFTAIGNKEDGYFLTLGKYRVTEGGNSLAQLKKLVKSRDWQLLTATIGIINEQFKEEVL